MKKIITAMLLVLLGVKLKSQSASELENKYWNYRDRLQKYFVQIGPGPGQSIPAASIESHNHYSDTFKIINGHEISIPYSNRNHYSGKIKYGDAALDHGWYMAVLATEYWLLKRKGLLNTERYKALCNELYFAVNAVDRLDEKAEQYLNYTAQPSKNGFFIRSDNNERFLEYFRKMQNPFQPIEILSSGGCSGPEILIKDTSNGGFRLYDTDSFRISTAGLEYNNKLFWPGGPGQFGSAQDLGNEMSQDQFIGILMGFKAIKKWVDADLVVDPDDSLMIFQAKNIRDWVSIITHRIMNHISLTRGDPIYIADEYNYLEEAEKYCEEVNQFPYIRRDTTWLSPPIMRIITLRDSLFNIIGYDTIYTYYIVRDTVSATYFSGSSLRACNPWDYIENEIKKKSGKFFKEANYIITNPVRDWSPVTRGHFALPFSYPIREIGQDITGQSYPEPFGKLKTGWQVVKYASDVTFVVGAAYGVVNVSGTSIKLPKVYLNTMTGIQKVTAFIQIISILSPVILDYMSKDYEYAAQVMSAFESSGCNFLLPSIDLVTTCIIGKPLIPAHKDFWRDLWNAFGKKEVFKWAMFGKNPSHMVHNLAIASGTWNHDDFCDWADFIGFKYSDLLYSMYNDKKPAKPDTFYRNALLAAQCQGPNHPGGHTYDANGVEIPSDVFQNNYPFNVEFLFSSPTSEPRGKNQFPESTFGLDYMLMYNFYRMADELHWGKSESSNYSVANCPCADYPAIRYTNPVRGILEAYTPNNYFSIGGRQFSNKQAFTPVNSVNGYTVEVFPQYDYYAQYNIRIPNFLLHNLELKGYIGFPDTAYGALIIDQDLTICHGKTEVKNLGKIIINQGSNPQFPSQLIVNRLAVLELNSNGLVEINNNTRLVIESGGTLKYHPGARIILNGPNAVLHIKGKLELAPGVTFQVEGGPNGKGYVIWDRGDGSPHYGNAELIAGAGSKMLFKEADYNKVALEVRGFSGMYLPNTLESFVADSCRINLKEQAFIMSDARLTKIKNVVVYGHNEGSTNPDFNFKPSSRGIHILGRKNTFTNVTIRDCYEAIKLFNVAGQNEPLNLSHVTLINNQIGVTNHGGRIIWNDGEIRDDNDNGVPTQLRTGISGIGTQGASLLRNVDLSIDDYTALTGSNIRFRAPGSTVISNIWSHGPGRYYLTKCKSENSQFGSIMHQSYLFPACSEFMNNSTGAYLLQGARLNAQNSSWNRFSWTPPDADRKFVYGVNGVYVHLDKGKNYIKGYNNMNNNLFFQAEIHQTQRLVPSDGISGFNSDAIQASGNQWAIGGVSSQLLTVPQPGNNACVGLTPYSTVTVSSGFLDLNYSPQYSGGNWDTDMLSACASISGPVNIWPIDSGVIMKINQNGGDGQLVAQLGDSLKQEFDRPLINYPDLIKRAKDLFMAPLPISVGGNIFEIYSRVHAIYPEAFTDTMIPAASRTAILNSLYQELNNMQNILISKADGNEPVMWTEYRFEIHRDKALIDRVFNNRPQSLMHLYSVTPSFSRVNDVQSLQAWTCLIEKEQAWIDSLIPYWMVSLDTCIMNLDSLGNWDSTYNEEWNPDWRNRHRGEGGFGEGGGFAPPPLEPGSPAEKSLKFELNIRPNPTSGSIRLRMSQTPEMVELINPQGQTVQTIRKGTQEMDLNLSYLPDGIYIVRVLHNTGVKTARIVKRTE